MPITKRNRPQIFLGLSEIAAILVVVFSVATLFDSLHRYLEMFSHFRLQYLVAAALLCIVFLLYRKRGYLFVAATMLVLNASTIAPYYLSPNEPVTAHESFKLIHANLLASNGNSERFIEWIAEEAPDVLVLQELTPKWLSSIKSVVSEYPFLVVEPRPDPFGIGVFSHLPLDDIDVSAAGPGAHPQVHVTITVADRNLRLISAHPVPPLGERNYLARNKELESVSSAIVESGGTVVLVGDLNVSMWSHHYRSLETKTGLRNARRGFGIEPSWPLFFLPAMIPIDHVLVSPDIAVLDFRSGPDIGSDHLPIVTTLAIKSD